MLLGVRTPDVDVAGGLAVARRDGVEDTQPVVGQLTVLGLGGLVEAAVELARLVSLRGVLGRLLLSGVRVVHAGDADVDQRTGEDLVVLVPATGLARATEGRLIEPGDGADLVGQGSGHALREDLVLLGVVLDPEAVRHVVDGRLGRALDADEHDLAQHVVPAGGGVVVVVAALGALELLADHVELAERFWALVELEGQVGPHVKVRTALEVDVDRAVRVADLVAVGVFRAGRRDVEVARATGDAAELLVGVVVAAGLPGVDGLLERGTVLAVAVAVDQPTVGTGHGDILGTSRGDKRQGDRHEDRDQQMCWPVAHTIQVGPLPVQTVGSSDSTLMVNSTSATLLPSRMAWTTWSSKAVMLRRDASFTRSLSVREM